MSLLKILEKTISAQKSTEFEIDECSEKEIDKFANTFVKIINQRELKSNNEIKNAKRAIAKKLEY